ncbi:MAG: glutamate 5-kinase [Oscillospiraceae bacterium]|nr:glutamate 5-kinase [Oscillospiraceae bacterium]
MYNLSGKKRVVIKVGTSTLSYANGNVNLRRIEELVKVLADLINSGRELLLVTSGAVGIGAARMGFSEKPHEVVQKQACAAIGQNILMHFYDSEFSKHSHTVAQILMTRDVIANKERSRNVSNTFRQLLLMKTVPIINANDSVSIEHLDFDENDTLSAMVAKLSDADLLVILTDVDGLYDKNPDLPDAKLIPVVNDVTNAMIHNANEKGSEFSSGGMLTKLEAAIIAKEGNIPTVIINGEHPEILYDLFENNAVCTLFTVD